MSAGSTSIKLKENMEQFVNTISQSNISNTEKDLFLKKSAEQLDDVLQCLLTFIKTHNVDTVLNQLPDTGQLLGRLNISRTVRGCPELYNKTNQCIQGLWRANPQNNLERKAAEWARMQIKSTVCLPQSSYYSVCELGIPPCDVTRENTHQITLHLKTKLRDKYKQRKEELLTSPKHKSVSIATDKSFMSIIPHLLNVPITSHLLSLWGNVIDVITLYPWEDPASKEICQQITNCLKLRKGFRPNLSASACHKLWTYSRASLEQEVLFRVDRCTQFILPSKMEQVWNDSYLIEVCSEDPLLCEVVCQMLTTLVVPSNTEILASFLQCVWLKNRQGSLKESLYLCDIYPSDYRQLVTLLAVHPQDIVQGNLGLHLKAICNYYTEVLTNHADTTKLLLLSLQFRHWYQQAVQYCFVCDRQFLSSCLELVACYSCVWLKTDLQSVRDILTRIVLCLRPLLVKSTLCYTDVMCVLSGNQVNSQGQMKSTIYQILLMFMYQASGGLNILTDVLKLVTSSDAVEDHMTCLMISHDLLNIDFSKWTIYKARQHKDVLCNFIEKTISDLHPDILGTAKSFIDDNTTLGQK